MALALLTQEGGQHSSWEVIMSMCLSGPTILRAETQDAESLCRVAISAFREDGSYRPRNAIGPPGHDDVAFHAKWIEEKQYVKYLVHSEIVAGCVFTVEAHAGKIEGLFVDSRFMNRGIGRELVQALVQAYDAIRIWELETPDYAVRNHAFYEKLGFVCCQITEPTPDIGFGFRTYRLRVGGAT